MKINLTHMFSNLTHKIQKLTIMFINLALIFSPCAHVFAIDEATLDFFDQNNIFYYNPSGIKNCSSVVPVTGNKVTIIGDSISVGAASEYDSQIQGADHSSKTYNGITYQLIQNSKHFALDSDDNYSGLTIAKQLQEQGELRPYIVFALGTNDAGSVTESTIDTLMNVVGSSHKVVLVTNYSYNNQLDYSSNNSAIKSAANKYTNIAVADWAAEVSKDQDKYIGDKYVHPNAEGSKLFVATISKALQSFGNSNIYSSSTGNGKNYAGDTVFGESELQMIENNKPFYVNAAQKYNLPWQLLAVLHSTENSLKRSNPTSQWDSTKSEGPYQLHSWAKSGKVYYPVKSELTDAEFQQATYDAAQFITESYSDLDLSSDDGVKRLLFRYNGTAQTYIDKAIAMGFSEEEAKNGEGSIYVMNRFDARRDPAHPEGMDPNWPGRYVADGNYDSTSTTIAFGTFVKFTAIGGSSTANYCGSGASGDITTTAIAISWEGHRTHPKNEPSPAYIEAMKSASTYIDPYNKDGVKAPRGASCDIFVSTVLIYSGVDPNFPKWGPSTQETYMQNHPEKYQRIEANGDVANLQSGDIFVHSGHIYIYIEINGQPGQASASFNDRTGEHFTGNPQFSDSKGEYHIYRVI